MQKHGAFLVPFLRFGDDKSNNGTRENNGKRARRLCAEFFA